jgi:hypothetical protein
VYRIGRSRPNRKWSTTSRFCGRAVGVAGLGPPGWHGMASLPCSQLRLSERGVQMAQLRILYERSAGSTARATACRGSGSRATARWTRSRVPSRRGIRCSRAPRRRGAETRASAGSRPTCSGGPDKEGVEFPPRSMPFWSCRDRPRTGDHPSPAPRPETGDGPRSTAIGTGNFHAGETGAESERGTRRVNPRRARLGRAPRGPPSTTDSPTAPPVAFDLLLPRVLLEVGREDMARPRGR